ncbi:MAG: WbqC family protein [Ghiorsea sp.]|nr:WbqC family protein [Ghiorsea sp.]
MTTITIHQPNYMPWSGFFHKWLIADTFVILDTVQYHKNEWQNRNQIKTSQGAQWITVPVTYRFPQTIQEVGIAPNHWAKKQISSIEQAYVKAPYFEQVWSAIKPILQQKHDTLVALNVSLIHTLGEQLGCTAPCLLASDLPVDNQDPTQRLIDICTHLQGTAYLSGAEGKNYLQKEAFQAASLDLYFQNIQPPAYPQLHGDFIPFLSVLDVLFNMGDEAQAIVRNMGGKTS